MEYLWHNSTNEHKMIYSRKGHFCFFLFFTSPVATFFHYFAQNVRVTPNLRKKGGERRRASKKQFIIAIRPAKRKSRAEEQYQVSILPLGKWRMWKTPFLYFFCSFPSYHFGGGIARAAAHKSFCFYALFSPEVFDKNCSIVLLTIDYYALYYY